MKGKKLSMEEEIIIKTFIDINNNGKVGINGT